MDDKEYKEQVEKMAHGEIELDMDSILVFSLSPSYPQYRDKIQELREALQDDDDDMESEGEGEDWNQRGKSNRSALQDDNSDNASSSQKRSHEEGKSDRKLPRLTLDDALIMVEEEEIDQQACVAKAHGRLRVAGRGERGVGARQSEGPRDG